MTPREREGCARRSRRYSHRMKAMRRCANCGAEPRPERTLCARCAESRARLKAERRAVDTGTMTREMALRILGRTA